MLMRQGPSRGQEGTLGTLSTPNPDWHQHQIVETRPSNVVLTAEVQLVYTKLHLQRMIFNPIFISIVTQGMGVQADLPSDLPRTLAMSHSQSLCLPNTQEQSQHDLFQHLCGYSCQVYQHGCNQKGFVQLELARDSDI